MKKIILMIVLITMSLQAEMRMAVETNGYFVTNGIKNKSLFGEGKIETFEKFIIRTTKCNKYKVLAMSQSKHGYPKILIDCLD